MALQESGRLEPSEPAWTWLDERIEGSLSAIQTAWRFLEIDWSPAAPQPAAPQPATPRSAALELGALVLPPATHFGASGSGRGEVPPLPPSFREGEKLSPSLRELYGRVGSKSALDAIPLAPGFNLASIPEEPADSDPAQVLAPIAGAYSTVWAYDACDAADPWKLYDPADPASSDLTAIDHEIGFWIDATMPVDLPSDGTLPVTTTFQLCTGWNLIGFPAGQPRHVRNALQSIEGKYVRVFGYDPTDAVDPWEIYDVAVPEWANDLELMQPGRGYWVLVTQAATLEIANQGNPPVVEIVSPSDLAVITEPTDVVGTVQSQLLDEWSLAYRPVGEPEWIEIARQAFPVTGAPLGSFDPTLLLNGLYELRLQALDLQGQLVEETIAVSVEGDMKIGHFTLSFIDLAIPLSGLDLEVIRTYDSREKRSLDFGVGWSLDIRQGSYSNNRPPGQGWRIVEGFLPCEISQELESHLTTIRLSDREVYRFRPELSGLAATLGGCFAHVGFQFIDGPVPGATLEVIGNDEVIYQNGSDFLIDSQTFELFEPQQVRFRTRDGRVFDLDLEDGVGRLEDANGNELTITPAGITHSSGVQVSFERDGEDRITRIVDPAGGDLVYTYDAAGDLERVVDRVGQTTTFTYDAQHLMVDLNAPTGVRTLRNEYDADGRLVRHIDAAGKVFEFTHDLAGRREVLTNRLGASRVLEYDERGNLVRQTDENGDVTTRTYDGRDNLLSTTDALGHTTSFTYSAANDLLTRTDPLGNTTAFTYGSRGQIETITDARGGVTRNTFDAAGNVVTTTDAFGQVTTLAYDGKGQVTSRTDALGHVTTFEYDSRGNVVRTVDALGHETLHTYDANGHRVSTTMTRTTPQGPQTITFAFVIDNIGRVLQVTDPEGAVTTHTYNALNSPVTAVDALGRTTTQTYDDQGRPVRVLYPDGTEQTTTYDDEGRVVAVSDRGGRLTTFVYDAAGRQLQTVFADGTSLSWTYDAAGRVTAVTDPRGATTAYEYDAAGRQTRIVDAVGGVTRFTYDAADNRTAMIDANNQTIAYEYDALGRLKRTVLANGSDQRAEYDAVGRLVREIDAAGAATEYEYDDLDRLVKVTDALDQETTFAYDELGHRVAQTDANGRTTVFESDRLGRQTLRRLPDGVEESFVFDAAGRLASHVDFSGRQLTFAYDAADRLVAKGFPNGTSTSFTYTASGQRASATDARGTTTYTYDNRDRLTRLTYPDGRALAYGWDANGNKTAMTAELGTASYAFAYAYDSLNRLTQVTDPTGQIYQHAYDAAGNRTSVTFPNQVTTTYQYDAANRLTGLTTGTAVGALESFQYTLAPTGHRTRIDELDGTVRSYTFDALYRLVGESVADGGGGLAFEETFTYDAVGNRLSSTRFDGAATVTTSSTYDARDRLTTRGAASLTWDANGNLTGRTAVDPATYGWDFEDRLVSALPGGGDESRYRYDADGELVRVEQDTAGGTETLDFLVDPTGFVSQVVAETDPAGNAVTIYVRGDDLLAILRPDGPRFTHADGLGSVRLLTDDSATVTDRYTYTAFGELLDHQGSDPNPYRFAGERLDPNTGFYHLRARWMDPQAGRFLSMDPFAGVSQDPLSLHRYLYAALDPVNNVDPTGERTTGLAGVLAALSVISLVISAVSFALEPSTKNFIYLAIDIVTFPLGFLKVLRLAAGGGKFRSLVNGFRSSLQATKIASEVAALKWLKDVRKLKVFLNEQGLKQIYELTGRAGKVVDFVAENPLSRRFVLTEAKSTLSGKTIKEIFSGNGKFSTSIGALRDLYQNGGKTFPGVEELVITAKRLKLHPKDPWKVLPDGTLLENGVPKQVDGVQVFVHLIPDLF